jgi:arginine/lysine/ornithine decarboxylase
LTAGLAYYLAMKKAPERLQILKAVYEEEFERASAEDRDRSNLTLTPSSTYYGFV